MIRKINKKGPMLFVLASGFVAISTFLFNFGLLHYLSKSEYSLWSFEVGLAILTFAILFEWIRVGALRRGVLINGWDAYFFSLYSLVYAISFIIIVIISINNEKYFILAAYLTFHSVHEFILARCRIYDKKSLYALMQFVKGGVYLIVLSVIATSTLFKIEVDSSFVSVLLLTIYILSICCIFASLLFNKSDVSIGFRKRFLWSRLYILSRYSGLFFINSFVGLGFFYIDRVLLKGYSLDGLIAENSAVMELVKQIVLFPINIISIYMYNNELKIANNKSLYLKTLNAKFKLLIFSLLLIGVVFFIFNTIIAEYYFPQDYIEYWRKYWFISVVSISLYAFKVYFFDQFFISIGKIRPVILLNILMFFLYILMFFYLAEYYDIISIFHSMFVSLTVIVIIQMYMYYKYFEGFAL